MRLGGLHTVKTGQEAPRRQSKRHTLGHSNIQRVLWERDIEVCGSNY